jgi:peroxiredoxin
MNETCSDTRGNARHRLWTVRLFLTPFLFSLFLFAGCGDTNTVGVEIGRKAPEISGESTSGVPVRLSGYKGKVVLLDFWATWCPPCRAMIPHEKDLHRQYDTRPFAILGISKDNQREDLKSFVDREKIPWPNLFDGGGSICKEWEISAFPTFVLIDHKGIIIGRWEGGGPQTSAEIERGVDEAVRQADKQQK